MKQEKIQWHPAFFEAIQLELEEYKDELEFIPESQLTTEPLKIDCVIIKKAKGLIIKKNIAKIFREVNILEYKSPDDYVSISDFRKVNAYAWLYSYIKNVPINSMSITFIESHQPKKLILHLKNELGLTVEKTSAGIYTVTEAMLPIQIIDSRKLSIDDNLWLKVLRKRLNHLECIQLIAETARQGKTTQIQAYLHAISQANTGTIKEILNMSRTGLDFYQIVEEVAVEKGLNAKWEARGEERKALAIAKKMVECNYPLEDIVSVTKLDSEKVMELYHITPRI